MFLSTGYIFQERTETIGTPRRTRGYIERKKESSNPPEATYLHHRKAILHKNTCQAGSSSLTGGLSRLHSQTGGRSESDIRKNATQRKDVVNCRDEIRFWNTQVVEDFHLDRAVSRWILVVPTCLSVCYMEMGAGKQAVTVLWLHRQCESVDNGGASAQGGQDGAKNMGSAISCDSLVGRGKVNLAETCKAGARDGPMHGCYLQAVLTRDHFALSPYLSQFTLSLEPALQWLHGLEIKYHILPPLFPIQPVACVPFARAFSLGPSSQTQKT